MVYTLVLGTSASACGFESHHSYESLLGMPNHFAD